MSNFVDPGRARRLIERDEKATRRTLRENAERRLRVSPEAAAVIIAADRVADLGVHDLTAHDYGERRFSRELVALREAVVALRKKRAEELAKP